MMNRLECEGFDVGYIDLDEALYPVLEEKYVIAKVESQDVARIKALENDGFSFHDRVLRMAVDTHLLAFSEEEKNKTIRFPVVLSTDFDKTIYELSYAAYKVDRRFHLLKEFNQDLANKVIDAYIQNCQNQNMKIVRCMHNDITLGITVLRDNGDGTVDNVLGAVLPNLQGKMAAYGLYMQTLMYIQEQGYKKYYGNVSASNAASINLHIAMGAKVESIYDEYILRRE